MVAGARLDVAIARIWPLLGAVRPVVCNVAFGHGQRAAIGATTLRGQLPMTEQSTPARPAPSNNRSSPCNTQGMMHNCGRRRPPVFALPPKAWPSERNIVVIAETGQQRAVGCDLSRRGTHVRSRGSSRPSLPQATVCGHRGRHSSGERAAGPAAARLTIVCRTYAADATRGHRRGCVGVLAAMAARRFVWHIGGPRTHTC